MDTACGGDSSFFFSPDCGAFILDYQRTRGETDIGCPATEMCSKELS